MTNFEGRLTKLRMTCLSSYLIENKLFEIMARAVEQIEREIAAIEQAVKAIAVELDSAYTSYLTILGQAMRHHLVMASYHLCTQGYPEQFLGLSFKERQKLQQAIQNLSQEACVQLLAHKLTSSKHQSELAENPHLNAIELEFSDGDNLDLLAISTEWENQAPPNLPELDFPQNEPEINSFKPCSSPDNEEPYPSNPKSLAQRQHNIEDAIAHTLKTASRSSNRLLHEAGILPQKLPEPLLETAAKAEASAETTAGPPNLLNLVIESENNQSGSIVTHIIAIHLRLSEIEFADVKVRTGRNQIRQLSSKVKSLGQEYHKKQREWTIAQAEAAWRSSWLEE